MACRRNSSQTCSRIVRRPAPFGAGHPSLGPAFPQCYSVLSQTTAGPMMRDSVPGSWLALSRRIARTIDAVQAIDERRDEADQSEMRKRTATGPAGMRPNRAARAATQSCRAAPQSLPVTAWQGDIQRTANPRSVNPPDSPNQKPPPRRRIPRAALSSQDCAVVPLTRLLRDAPRFPAALPGLNGLVRAICRWSTARHTSNSSTPRAGHHLRPFIAAVRLASDEDWGSKHLHGYCILHTLLMRSFLPEQYTMLNQVLEACTARIRREDFELFCIEPGSMCGSQVGSFPPPGLACAPRHPPQKVQEVSWSPVDAHLDGFRTCPVPVSTEYCTSHEAFQLA
ncbi:hypothetical protein CCMA1212_003558 [Trichoderma ghanense]|uniref:Uncharacterized protein n=1 Tax=Trichoderma ghanense TaxID=65468 RepID=A0ABY2H850_9HYPO